MAWPPALSDFKADLEIPSDDTTTDVAFQEVLDAAVAYVERVRAGDYAFTGEPTVLLPAPPDDLVLGTIRLAGRWHRRRQSPDGLVSMGELGTGRIPSVDPDIERMLGVGRYAPPRFA